MSPVVLMIAGILTFWMLYWFVRKGGIGLFRKPLMVEVPSSPPPRTKPSRLYLGSPDKCIEIDDWDVFRKKTIPELQAAGWNAVPMEGQGLTHPVPPARPQDDPVLYYLLGIVDTVPWPRARPKHHIHKFQKPLKPLSSAEENADLKIWLYFHPKDWQLGDPEIGSKDYDEAHRALSEFIPRYGLFGEGLYADIGYESIVGDDRARGLLNIVSTAFKDAIESVEPRVHHFFPYEIRCADGRIIQDYWIFVHRGSVTALDPIASCFVQHFREDGIGYFHNYVSWTHTEVAENRLVVSGDALGGRHYAIDPHDSRPIISAALAERLRPVVWKNQQPIPLTVRND
jgi:hypothetical protein